MHGTEGSVQPHGGVLKDVVGVFPAADARKAAEHPVSEGVEPVGANLDDPVSGREIPPFEPLKAFCQGN